MKVSLLSAEDDRHRGIGDLFAIIKSYPFGYILDEMFILTALLLPAGVYVIIP